MTQQLAGIGDAWFAIQVWTGREQLTARHLRLHGYRIFLPCYCERRPWSDRIKKIERALFAGYLFCQMQPAIVANIIGTPGVIQLVGDGSRPIPIPNEEIEAIQRVVEASVRAEPWPFVEGEIVRIDAGPIAGTRGVVVKVNHRQRLVVSIPLLHRAVAVEIDPEWASALGRPYAGGELRFG